MPETNPPNTRVAWVVGGSGMLGRALIETLLAAPEYERIIAITRRPLGFDRPRLANRIARFERLESELAGLACGDLYCCLGTTARTAGSDAAFRAVDYDLVLRFAQLANAAQLKRMLVVTSVGADVKSKHFYLRVKGEVEAALVALALPSLDIFRPGLLLGPRPELRPLELAARVAMPLINPLMVGGLRPYRGIDVATLARAMLGAARSGRRGTATYGYDAIVKLAGR